MYHDHEDTDPGFTLAAMTPVRVYLDVTRFLGRRRRLFVPLGVMALVGLGVHAAADRFDDWFFLLLDAADRGLEAMYGAFADAVLRDPELRRVEFAAHIDLADKERWAQWGALIIEILVDLRLALGALGAFDDDDLGYVVPGSGLHHRLWGVVGRQIHRLRGVLRRAGGYLRHLSVEKVYLPVAVGLAVLAGALALFVALDNAFFALGQHLPIQWRFLSPWPALFTSALVLVRIGLPAVVGSLARCQRIMERDLAALEPVTKRTLRGAWGAALILPLLLAGVWSGTPLGSWARQIFSAAGS